MATAHNRSVYNSPLKHLVVPQG